MYEYNSVNKVALICISALIGFLRIPVTSVHRYEDKAVKFVVFVVICVYFFFYFKCRTAGYRSVLGRSCERPSRHRFFLVSLCPKANAEMVPKIPSCHYMLLM